MKMNLPNKLTLLRLCLVPVFVVIMMVSSAVWASAVGLFLFIAASLTDMLDGKIARKYGLITDFGKFMDPLADKFMVIGAMFVILYRALTLYQDTLFANLFFWAFLIVIFRELAVTSIRLVVSGSSGIVIAANMLGKIKTVMQIVFISTVFIEPAIYSISAVKNALPTWWVEYPPLSYLTGGLTLLFTVWSGINYFIGMWKYLDPEK